MFTGVPADRASESADLARSARQELAGSRFADVRWVARTGSTNSDVMALARDGAGEGVVLVADRQDQGRGRQGRRWVAPPGGSLLVSVLLRPPAALAGALGMAAGVALAEAIDSHTGWSGATLKWPNDVVVGDRKLAGILAEADWPPGITASGGWRSPAPHDRLVVVVGLGVNVNWPPGGDRVGRGDGVAEDVAEVATALNWLVGKDVDRVGLLVALLQRLDEHYSAVRHDRSAATTLDRWRQRSATLGRRVRVDLGADDVEGTAVDITGEGHLVVETLEGERRTFAAGDVVHLRPADP
jgi:BirA family transcriptional regulator, biotin operon repressor / biotin---[acetyl-CoA-carboxylase] ligase